MAIKPTIYKFKVVLSDIDRHCYESLSLVLAKHPSETEERLLLRLLAYLINFRAGIEFTRGLSSTEEADVWVKAPDGSVDLWIEVGEPSEQRLKKASSLANELVVFNLNTNKSKMWWDKLSAKMSSSKLDVITLESQGMMAFVALLKRTMEFSVTINNNSAFVATEDGEFEITWHNLSVPNA